MSVRFETRVTSSLSRQHECHSARQHPFGERGRLERPRFPRLRNGRGTTYNAYLVRDEKTALVDTVKAPFAAETAERGRRWCDPRAVDYVVCNHAELDHAGRCRKCCGPCRRRRWSATRSAPPRWPIISTPRPGKSQIVASGETISLGRRTLRFVETPMVHWPESMATYVPEEKLLFSMDAFGQHYATAERFDDEVDLRPCCGDQAKTYYANIVMPYGKAVQTAWNARRIADRDDRPEPRADLAAPRGGDPRRLSPLGHPPAGAEGAGDLRHDVGEHGGDGRGHLGRGLAAGRHRVADSRPPNQPDADRRGGAGRRRRGLRLRDAQSHA